MKRQYEGHLSEEKFGELNLLMLNFKYGGKARLESLFEEFYGPNIRITIETLEGRVKEPIKMGAVICPA
jgi:hypothetical protein